MDTEVKSKKSEKDGIGKTISLILFFAIVVILLVSGVIIFHYFLGGDIPGVKIQSEATAQYWGQIGDFFGGVLNPLLSFLALMAVAASLRVQSLELKSARIEAAAAQELLGKQTKVLEKQQAVLERQNFEATFFGLFQLHERNVQGITLRYGEEPDRGRMAFGALANRFNSDRIDFTDLNERESYLVVKAHVQKFYSVSYGELGHYYRTLEEVFSYIESFGQPSILGAALAYAQSQPFGWQDNKEKLRRRYAGIVVASLSNAELECIFMHCMAIEGAGLKVYVEKYGLLDNLMPRNNNQNPVLQKAYADGAFSRK